MVCFSLDDGANGSAFRGGHDPRGQWSSQLLHFNAEQTGHTHKALLRLRGHKATTWRMEKKQLQLLNMDLCMCNIVSFIHLFISRAQGPYTKF